MTLAYFKLFGKRLTSLLLHPVFFYYFLTDKKGRKASGEYFQKLSKYHKLKKFSLWDSYKQYVSFGDSMLDKLTVRIPRKAKKIKLHVENYEHIKDIVSTDRGAIFIGAHVGNFDVLRLLGTNRDELHCKDDITIKALMYRKHAALINSLFKDLNTAEDNSIIELENIDLSSAGLLIDEIEQGTFIGILGDRETVNSSKSVELPFLGENTQFPMGPWVIANILKCPVVFFSVAYEKPYHYRIRFQKLFDQVKIKGKNKEAQAKTYIERYITEIEQFCKEYPYQWYNFYDFWDSDKSGTMK